MNLPFGISESPRHCRWKAPQHCASHSNNSPGFSQICGEGSTMSALSNLLPQLIPGSDNPRAGQHCQRRPLRKNANFSLCQLIQVVCASPLPFAIQSLLPCIGSNESYIGHVSLTSVNFSKRRGNHRGTAQFRAQKAG